MPEKATGKLPIAMRLGNQIKQCEQVLIAEKSRILREFDLTVPQYAALLVLSETPKISGARLARGCGVTAQAVTGLVNLLDERGLISRTRSDVHAKVLIIDLTRSGRALLRRADEAAIVVEQRLLNAYTDDQLTAFRGYLETMRAALSGETAKRVQA